MTPRLVVDNPIKLELDTYRMDAGRKVARALVNPINVVVSSVDRKVTAGGRDDHIVMIIIPRPPRSLFFFRCLAPAGRTCCLPVQLSPSSSGRDGWARGHISILRSRVGPEGARVSANEEVVWDASCSVSCHILSLPETSKLSIRKFANRQISLSLLLWSSLINATSAGGGDRRRDTHTGVYHGVRGQISTASPFTASLTNSGNWLLKANEDHRQAIRRSVFQREPTPLLLSAVASPHSDRPMYLEMYCSGENALAAVVTGFLNLSWTFFPTARLVSSQNFFIPVEVIDSMWSSSSCHRLRVSGDSSSSVNTLTMYLRMTPGVGSFGSSMGSSMGSSSENTLTRCRRKLPASPSGPVTEHRAAERVINTGTGARPNEVIPQRHTSGGGGGGGGGG
ncbi:hypothetical protein BV898_11052 [Hypsibius exemplaris]|uniref:Uncharacterized protein n=1 Tax=Hypsibius exemplaris TaxID=2072580 RepID=A0A1W0WHX6_HYPEX|nr:hypothetical protein BV898_11052 [Hypsibius exemplaris]